ncbi:MAG: M20/M25/M40 family metallo-hydrolase [Salinarchaeum sp.]
MPEALNLEAFHRQAVKTPSHEDVTAMRDLLVETIEDAGIEARVDTAGNVLASRGTGDTHLVLNTHIDTVPPHVSYERTQTVPDSDDQTAVVRGRGACDAKGPLAALLAAFLDADIDDGRVTLAVTPDEETDQTGAAALVDGLDADAVIVGEPTGLDVCNAARGLISGEIRLTGEAAHAANPDAGRNAVAAAADALAALATFDDRYGPGEHDTLGAPTLTPTRIDGGDAINQVPAACRITIDRRSVPPETAERFTETFETHVREAVPDSVGVELWLANEETPFLEAFETDPQDRIVETMVAASGSSIRPFGAATEASYFAAVAPTVIFGPGDLTDEVGPVAHAEREYVTVDELYDAAESLTTAIERFC